MTQKKKKARISNFFANAFYHSKFKDKLFVVKASGDLIENDEALDSLMANIKKLTTFMGIKILLIYGGGKAVDKALEERGIPVKKRKRTSYYRSCHAERHQGSHWRTSLFARL
ncbi:MAG: hypothetical protein LRY54_00645 [Alphaproteobacteria bacterium]|nr:hypothetical protein [Alphaproteobacteria bacterium]